MTDQSVSKLDFMKLASIVQSTPEDFSDIRELHKTSIKSAGWHYYSLAEVDAKLNEIDEPDYTISLLNQNVLLAKINNILVGSCAWRPSEEHPQTAVITHLYIHPAYSNGGIATALIEENEQVAYNSGFRWISARSDFNSRSFFTQLGYKTKGFRGCNTPRAIQYPLQVMTRHISSLFADSPEKKTYTGDLVVHEPVISD